MLHVAQHEPPIFKAYMPHVHVHVAAPLALNPTFSPIPTLTIMPRVKIQEDEIGNKLADAGSNDLPPLLPISCRERMISPLETGLRCPSVIATCVALGPMDVA